MHIGGLKPCNNVFLAPMAGVTDLPMRELAVELGAGMAVGEMQSADLSLAQSRKTTQRQRHSALAGLRSVQIVGYDPRQLAEAARFNADLGADIIDINMGCPAKKVCRRAAGSALLADEALVGRILEAIVNAVDVPVTVKIRTGTDPEHRNGVTIARIAESAGIQMLTVHGRTRADRFKGQAEYQTIGEIVSAVTIPVIANGELWTPADVARCAEISGCGAFMLARGALCRPDLGAAIVAAGQGEAGPTFSWSEAQQLLVTFLARNRALYDPRYAVNPVKQWLVYLKVYYPQAAALFSEVKRITDPDDMALALQGHPRLASAA